MAVFIVLWSCLFTTKLMCLQKKKSGHSTHQESPKKDSVHFKIWMNKWQKIWNSWFLEPPVLFGGHLKNVFKRALNPLCYVQFYTFAKLDFRISVLKTFSTYLGRPRPLSLTKMEIRLNIRPYKTPWFDYFSEFQG